MKLKAKRTRSPLQARIADLQDRLREAEETISAIRRGEVDAVVVAGEEGDQIFTLQGAERPYRMLIEQMSEGAAILSTARLILYCNARFAEMVRTPLDKIIGTPFARFVAPDAQAVFESSLDQQTPAKLEARLGAGPDANLPVQLSINRINTDGAQIVGVVITDLTEQKRAEESLRKSNAYNRSLFEASLDPLAAADSNGKITDVNAAVEKITGVGRKDLIGDDYAKYFSEPEKARAAFLQAYREGFVQDVSLELRRRDGQLVQLLCNAVVLRDETGKVVGILAGGRDISQLVAAEQSLRESEERYRAVVAASSQIIWLTNAQGEIVEDHPSWREFTGFTFDEGKGFGWVNALHPDDRTPVLTTWRSAVASGTPFETEYRFRRRDGEYRLFAVYGVPVRRPDGTIREWVGTCTDITERRRHERERELLFESIRKIVAQLASLSDELLAASSRHAEGACRQVAAVSETAATAAEMSQAAGEAAEHAKGVGEAVSRTADIGRTGRKAVEDTIDALGQVRVKTEASATDIAALADPAQAIAEIVAVINDLAEQTHLLALNAAMEAARAGEHGRGFSVVTVEIKSLAEQSKKATSDIRRILGEILKKTDSAIGSMEDVTKSVAGAVQVSAQAGETIRTLSETLVEVSQSARQIVAASEHQATATVQMRQSTTQIDEIARQHLHAAQNLQDAAQALSSLAAELAALAGADSDADNVSSAPLP